MAATVAAAAADAGPGVAVPVDLRREQRMVCVEYPGVVRDVPKMLRTLGGEEGVSRVRSGRDRGVDGVSRPRPGGGGRGDHPGEAQFPWQRRWGRSLGRQWAGTYLPSPGRTACRANAGKGL